MSLSLLNLNLQKLRKSCEFWWDLCSFNFVYLTIHVSYGTTHHHKTFFSRIMNGLPNFCSESMNTVSTLNISSELLSLPKCCLGIFSVFLVHHKSGHWRSLWKIFELDLCFQNFPFPLRLYVHDWGILLKTLQSFYHFEEI